MGKKSDEVFGLGTILGVAATVLGNKTFQAGAKGLKEFVAKEVKAVMLDEGQVRGNYLQDVAKLEAGKLAKELNSGQIRKFLVEACDHHEEGEFYRRLGSVPRDKDFGWMYVIWYLGSLPDYKSFHEAVENLNHDNLAQRAMRFTDEERAKKMRDRSRKVINGTKKALTEFDRALDEHVAPHLETIAGELRKRNAKRR